MHLGWCEVQSRSMPLRGLIACALWIGTIGGCAPQPSLQPATHVLPSPTGSTETASPADFVLAPSSAETERAFASVLKDPHSYTNADMRLVAAVREVAGTDEVAWAVDLEIQRPQRAAEELVLQRSTLIGCEQASAVVEGLPSLRDPRLAMLNFLCDRGEDYLSRTVVTALVFVSNPPAILWEGEGKYANEMGQCETIDVPFFDRGPSGSVRVLRHIEVVHTLPDVPSTPRVRCKATARKDQLIGELAVP